MNKATRQAFSTALRMSGAAAVAALALSAPASAEYRCAAAGGLAAGEKKACELARRHSPDALVQFVNRTKGTYGLAVDDYVSQADADRWEQAKQHPVIDDSPTIAKVKNDRQGSKAD
jgi:hypothetical protein